MSKYDFRGAPEAPAIEELWLNYFNSYLFEHGTISENEYKRMTEKIAETYTATLDSARAAGGPLLITVPSTGGGAAGKDRLTRYIREAIGVKI